jgi:hypothetical protein
VHVSNKSEAEFKKRLGAFKNLKTHLPPGKSCGIPFRSLLPINFNNLIVAGRSLSADRLVHGAARTMPTCFAMGEAAGTAAALAKKHAVDIKNIAIGKLQRQLIKQGARIY